MTRNSGRANNPSIQLKSMALVPPLSGGMTLQNFARKPVLVNNRLSAACYRTQTLASDLAKSHKYSRLTRRPLQEQKGLDERPLVFPLSCLDSPFSCQALVGCRCLHTLSRP